MLVGRCSSELSSYKLQAKSKKSQAPSEADLGLPGRVLQFRGPFVKMFFDRA